MNPNIRCRVFSEGDIINCVPNARQVGRGQRCHPNVYGLFHDLFRVVQHQTYLVDRPEGYLLARVSLHLDLSVVVANVIFWYGPGVHVVQENQAVFEGAERRTESVNVKGKREDGDVGVPPFFSLSSIVSPPSVQPSDVSSPLSPGPFVFAHRGPANYPVMQMALRQHWHLTQVLQKVPHQVYPHQIH